MTITIKTFNGHNINDGSSYRTAGLDFLTRPGAGLVFVSQANGEPTYAGTYTGGARSIPLTISVTDYANLDALTEQINVWLKPGQSGYLVGTFSADGEDYQLYCTVQSLVPDGHYQGYFTAVLQSGPSEWAAVEAETDTWAADDETLTKEITVGGTVETRLIASLAAPGPAIAGWQYQYLYQLINAPGIDYGLHPWCIILDTATMKNDGDLREDCYDLRIVVNSQEVKRWVSNPNTDHTHVWFNLTLGAGYQIKLATEIPDTGEVGEIQCKKDANNLAALKGLPASGLLRHGTEWIQYNGKDLKTYKLGIKTSGALGTMRQTHVVGAVFSFIQNVVYVLAGNADATDPAADDSTYDDDKPVFDLGASDNTQWIYTASTLFYDPVHPARPGSWTPVWDVNGTISTVYNYTQNAASGNPALGLLEGCWQKGANWQTESGWLAWRMNSPGGFGVVEFTGSKYRSTARWPPTAGMQKSVDQKNWTTINAQTTPVSVSTWTAINVSPFGITSDARWLQVVLSGSLSALANALCYLEMLTLRFTFYSDNLPAGTLFTQAVNYPLSVRISNQENGDAMELLYPMLLDKTMLLDGENYEAFYDGVNVHGALTLDDDSRDVWIRLQPGANTLEIEALEAGNDIGDLDIDLRWYARRP